ncbi:MAG: hypothetical protein CVT88_07880 [Candidatus Altiarchaeales archaeon HGW-Altiarchaeales-1]|nr:MAG: hypothetical protein CVT88_07880 [Candidatus Altiarchaeales archaeon HGW-Altiarchaeales-1]
MDVINYEIGKNLKDVILSYNKHISDLEKNSHDGNELVERIKGRLGKFTEITKTYILEYPYVEKEWRELYALHYSKTVYFSTPFAFRIHLISEDINNINEIDSGSYQGYFTLRPLLLPSQCVISKIVLKPNKDFYEIKEGEELYMVTGEYNIHIGNKHLKIETFPFFSQDGAVTRCAHADLYMISELMHIKHNMNPPTIEKIISRAPPSMYGRKIPSVKELTIQDMAISLLENGYFVRVIGNGDIKNVLKYIDTYIESGIPCIIAFKNHVIVVCGHTLKNGVVDNYIIFDDSGYHIKETFGKGEKYSVKIEKEKLGKKLREEDKSVFLFSIEFERVYFPGESINKMVSDNLYLFNWADIPGNNSKRFIDYLIKNLKIDWVGNAEIKKSNDGKTITVIKDENSLELKLDEKEYEVILKTSSGKTNKYIVKKENDEINIYKNLKYHRILLVDSRYMKEKLYEAGVDINSVFLPHYVWYIEFYGEQRGDIENLAGSVIVDASSHPVKGRIIKNNLKPNKVVSILTRI